MIVISLSIIKKREGRNMKIEGKAITHGYSYISQNGRLTTFDKRVFGETYFDKINIISYQN